MGDDAERRVEQTRTVQQRLDSEQLFRGGREVQIEHRGEIYRLQLTRQGKLILTK